MDGFPPPPPPPPPAPPRRRRPLLWALATIAGLAALVLGVGGALAVVGGGSAPFPPGTSAPSSTVKPVTQRTLTPSDIASQVDPAIVDVETTLGLQNAQAAGTGMVLTSSGEVLTNNHVVEGATSISVKISTESKTYKATVLGTDPTDDVALLKMQGASGLPTVTLGNSSQVSVGDSVVAIGNALNRPGPPAVTSGTITGVSRSITVRDDRGDSKRLTDLLETDAELQPGNSGGPLLNGAGQVVGMNTAASSGGYITQSSNDGFATPVDKVKPIVQQIESGREDNTVHVGPRGFLGVQLQPSASQQPGGDFIPGGGRSRTGAGAVVSGVEPNSPAEGAGLATGDTITSLDGTSVTSTTSLSNLIGAKHPGDNVKLTWVDESGNQHSATVHLASAPTTD